MSAALTHSLRARSLEGSDGLGLDGEPSPAAGADQILETQELRMEMLHLARDSTGYCWRRVLGIVAIC